MWLQSLRLDGGVGSLLQFVHDIGGSSEFPPQGVPRRIEHQLNCNTNRILLNITRIVISHEKIKSECVYILPTLITKVLSSDYFYKGMKIKQDIEVHFKFVFEDSQPVWRHNVNVIISLHWIQDTQIQVGSLIYDPVRPQYTSWCVNTRKKTILSQYCWVLGTFYPPCDLFSSSPDF